MKLKHQVLLGLSSILFSTFSYANFSIPCSGDPGSYYTNSDESAGGFVASTVGKSTK